MNALRRFSIPGLLFGATLFLWTAYLCPALAQDGFEPAWDNETGQEANAEPEEKLPPIPDTQAEEACEIGESDAHQYHSTTGHMVGGFFCGILGFAIAAAARPQPPVDRIVGQPAEFVLIYTRCYEKQARNRSMRAACGGWAMGAATALLIQSLQAS